MDDTNSPTGTTPVANDADYLMELFEDGLVPPNPMHEAAVPDYYREDETVYADNR